MSCARWLQVARFAPVFLAYPNFQIFLEWNQSIVYSTSAAYLATRIAGAPAMHRGSKIPTFASAQTRELQRLLPLLRHDVGKWQPLLARGGEAAGKISASLGQKSRAAVKAEQIKLALPADSYPTPELV